MSVYGDHKSGDYPREERDSAMDGSGTEVGSAAVAPGSDSGAVAGPVSEGTGSGTMTGSKTATAATELKDNPDYSTPPTKLYPACPLETLAGRRLVLVVTGGVAAYKAAELARLWVRAGAQVRVVLTENGARFVTPLTFEALTGQPVSTDLWGRPSGQNFEIEHIALADWAEAVVVAPATANFLAKMAHGLADDLASTFILATSAPKLVAPAMNSQMLAAPATVANLDLLAERGVTVIQPGCGLLACGTLGDGRLAEVETVALMAARALSPSDLSGVKIAVSAGSTWEAWDDIRFLTNRSSGRMGLDLALSAWLRGAVVEVVAGPAVSPPPFLPDFSFKVVESTRDMREALGAIDFQILIMAAAPADFCPAEPRSGKIKKGFGLPLLPLAANPDILQSLPRRPGVLYVGFAAEDAELVPRARGKLEAKKLDMVVANRAGSKATGGAFASAENHLWLVFKDREEEEVSLRPKFSAAEVVIEAVVKEFLKKRKLLVRR